MLLAAPGRQVHLHDDRKGQGTHTHTYKVGIRASPGFERDGGNWGVSCSMGRVVTVLESRVQAEEGHDELRGWIRAREGKRMGVAELRWRGRGEIDGQYFNSIWGGLP